MWKLRCLCATSLLFLLVGTASAQSFFDFFNPTPPARSAVSEAELRQRFCTVQSKALRLPVVLDQKLKAELIEKMGEEFSAKLLRPVARANFVHRCMCAPSLEARVRMGC